MPRLLDKGMLAMLGLLLALIIGNAFVESHNVRQLQQARLKVEASERTHAALQRVLSAVQDAETGVRGYVITGEATYLDPYQAAVAQLEARFAELEAAIADSGPAALVPELRRRTRDVMQRLAAIHAARRDGGYYAAREVVRTNGAKQAMDQVRELVAQMREAESDVLRGRAAASEHSVELAQASAFFAAVLGALLLGALLWQLRRDALFRNEAAAALQAKEELLRTTLANLADAVVTCDAQGRVTYLNPAAATLTGWTPEHAQGQPVSDIVRVVEAGSHEALENAAERALREGARASFAVRGRLVPRGNGEDRPVEEGAEPILAADGSIAGVVLVFRDVTERKRWEDAIVEADRRKDEFLAVLAHELRNPLAPLRNALHIVRTAGQDKRALDQVWGMMDRQVRQMVRLIDDLLDVSRITRNKLELRREPVALAEVVEAAIEMSAPTIARFGHRVDVRLADGMPPLDGDRARLVQVIDNLVTNAAKYSEPGGTITIQARAEPGFARLLVRDTGLGIPPEMLERIFEMFTQVDRTLDKSRGGLGIGLTLVKRIVELHGGQIVARSGGPGLGSEFEVVLPLASDVPAIGSGPVMLDPAIGPPRRIVVADDNADAAETLARMLRMLGHEVRVAFDGEECVAVCEEFRPDAALLDVGMPRQDGYATARAIRSRSWGARTLLIAITGWGQESDRVRALESGFDHHLTKPADFTRLSQIIRTLDAGAAGNGSEASHAKA